MKKIYDNRMEITFDSKSENEGLARVVAAAFCAKLDPTIEEISDIKTAVWRLLRIVLFMDMTEGMAL